MDASDCLSSLALERTLNAHPWVTGTLTSTSAGCAQGTILPGVTRKSVIQLARQLGYEVEETNVTVTEAMDADEIFTTGTAVVVSAVGSLTHRVSTTSNIHDMS